MNICFYFNLLLSLLVFSNGFSVSLDEQVVRIEDHLHTVKDLNLSPPSSSSMKVNEYYGWGDKLLKVLQETNDGLGSALTDLISSHTSTKKGEKNQRTHRKSFFLKRQEIINGYYEGLTIGATHMMIVWDTYDYEDSYNFIVYCQPEENILDLLNHYNAPGFYRVSSVYAMHLAIEEQIYEGRPWHIEYPDN